MFNIARTVLSNSFQTAGKAGGDLFIVGGKNVLEKNTREVLRQNVEFFTGGSLTSGNVSTATRLRALVPGGKKVVATTAAKQSAGAIGRAGAAAGVISAGLAILEVKDDVRSGSVSMGSAREFIARQAGKGCIAGMAGTGAILLVSSLTGPLAPVTCVVLGTAVTIGTQYGLDQVEEDYFPQLDAGISAMKDKRKILAKSRTSPEVAG